MSRIVYILAANYNRKHLENCKLDWKTPGFFSSKRMGTLLSIMTCNDILFLTPVIPLSYSYPGRVTDTPVSATKLCN